MEDEPVQLKKNKYLCEDLPSLGSPDLQMLQLQLCWLKPWKVVSYSGDLRQGETSVARLW